MSLNETVSAERVHISFFGRRNAGKSSMVNAVTGQNLAVVSDVKGTTTDPVKKSMELLPIGPVVIIDTPGFDDEGALGELRVQKTREILAKTDVAVLVLDATEEIGEQEQEFLALLQVKKLPFVVVYNKVDLLEDETNKPDIVEVEVNKEDLVEAAINEADFVDGIAKKETLIDGSLKRAEVVEVAAKAADLVKEAVKKADIVENTVNTVEGVNAEANKAETETSEKAQIHAIDSIKNVSENMYPEIYVSATNNINIEELKNLLGTLAKTKENNKRIVADLLEKGDVVILVTPIDESAPKGRLILPQQQTIRDILDAGCMAFVCQDTELPQTLAALAKQPKMVITDSQAFGRVSKMVPENIPLTSFSILFARYKGDLATQVKGAAMLSELQDGDKILIAEGCTHHRQCGDIGTVKLPNWIRKLSGADVQIDFTSGGEFPEDLSEYKLIVHCGGCMLNETEMKHRIAKAKEADVPMTNYGVAIAHANGILKRSLELFPEILKLF